MADQEEKAGGTGTGGGNGGGEPAPVPYERFQKTVAARNALAEEVSTLKADLQRVSERAATADTLAKQIEDLRGQYTAKEAVWGEEREVLNLGIADEDGREVVRALHRRLPEKDRPKLGEWWSSLAADPTKAPKPLQPYLTAVERAAEKVAEKVEKRETPGRTAAGSSETVSSAGKATPAQLAALREAAIRSGWTGPAAAAWKAAAGVK